MHRLQVAKQSFDLMRISCRIEAILRDGRLLMGARDEKFSESEVFKCINTANPELTRLLCL